MRSTKENSIEPLCHRWELNPGHGEDSAHVNMKLPVSDTDLTGEGSRIPSMGRIMYLFGNKLVAWR